MLRAAHWVRRGTWLCLGLGLLPLLGTLLAFWGEPGLVAVPLDWNAVAQTLMRSLALALCVCAVAVLFGSLFAWVQARWTYPGQALLARLTVLPLVLPSFLLAISLREAMAPQGLLGEPLGLTGRFEGFWASVLVLGCACAPYVQLTLSSAAAALPRDQEEAAQSLGAGPWRLFWEIQLPALRPALSFGALLVLLYALADFGAVAVLNTRVLTWELFQASNYGGPNAAALGLVTVAAVLPLVALGRWIQGRQGGEALGRRGLRPASRHRPAPLQLLGLYGLQALFLSLALGIPLLIIGRWGLSGALAGNLPQAALTTLGLGLGAGLLALFLGGLPARSSAQRSGGGALTEFLAYGVSGLPGVLTAFGFLQLVQLLPKSLAQPLEGFFVLLLLGLGIRFLAHSYGGLKPAFLREDPRPIEAAQTLGASNWRIFRQVRLPHLAPAGVAAFLLAFIAAVKELPITLMLLPAGHQSLATIIYDGHEDAHLAELGASALLLLAMVLVAQTLLRRWSPHD